MQFVFCQHGFCISESPMSQIASHQRNWHAIIFSSAVPGPLRSWSMIAFMSGCSIVNWSPNSFSGPSLRGWPQMQDASLFGPYSFLRVLFSDSLRPEVQSCFLRRQDIVKVCKLTARRKEFCQFLQELKQCNQGVSCRQQCDNLGSICFNMSCQTHASNRHIEGTCAGSVLQPASVSLRLRQL